MAAEGPGRAEFIERVKPSDTELPQPGYFLVMLYGEILETLKIQENIKQRRQKL